MSNPMKSLENENKGKDLRLRRGSDTLMAQIIYFVAFGIWLVFKLLVRTWYYAPVTSALPPEIVRTIYLLLLVITEIIYGRKDARSLWGFLAAACMLTIAVSVDYKNIADGIAFIFVARNIPFKKIARFSMVILGSLGIFVIITSLFDIIPNAVYLSEGRIDRYALGFVHPNTGPMSFLFVFMIWSYLRGDRFGIADALGLLAFDAFLFYFTNSRTSFILTVALVITMLAFRYVPIKKELSGRMQMALAGIVVIVAVFSIIMSIAYNPDAAWMSALNRILSDRLALSHRALEEYGVTAFGQKITFGAGSNYNLISGQWIKRNNEIIVDNMYIRIMLSCGTVFLIAALAISTLSNLILIRRKEYRLIAIITIAAISGLMEQHAALAYCNCFLFLMALPFAEERGKDFP